MQAYTPQSCLIKNAKNISFFFYLDKHKLINYKIFSPDNTLISNEEAYPQPVIDFSATIDNKDQLHLICITKEGSLLYLVNILGKWEHKQLAKLDFKSNTYRHLTLLHRRDYTHVFCNKTNLLSPMITSIEHMYWNEKTFNKGTIITYMPGKFLAPFQVDMDSINNVHLIYKVMHRNNHQLSYCKFNVFNKKWSTGEIVTNLQEDNNHPFLLIDRKDNMHVAWCTIIDNNFTLKYRRKSSIINQKARWSPIVQLSNKNANYFSPLLLQEGNTIKLLSRQNDNINEINSADYGLSWTPLNTVKGFSLENAELIRYSSNATNERSYYISSFIYGIVEDGINILGSRLYYQPPKNPMEGYNETIVQPTATPRLESPNIPLNTEDQQEESMKPVEQEINDLIEEAPHEEVQADPDEASIEIDEDIKSEEALQVPLKNEDKAQEEHIFIDANLKSMIQEVQGYVNKMMTEIEKLEANQRAVEDHQPVVNSQLTTELVSEELHTQLRELNSNLIKLEDEQLKLECQLGEFHKKIYNIEDRLIAYKKQFMELEEKTYQSLHSSSSIVNRVISFFK